jgi:tripartite ATP-independent transporter DctM subunit
MKQNRGSGLLAAAENSIVTVILVLLAAIPIVEVILRKVVQTGIPGATNYIFHLVLWVTFVGGLITTRENRHLALNITSEAVKEPFSVYIKTVNSFLSVAFSFAFCLSSLSFVFIGFDPSRKVGIFPIQLITAIMPIGFLLIAVRFYAASPKKGSSRLITFFGFILGLFLGLGPLTNIAYTFLFEIPPFIDILADIQYTVGPVLTLPLIIVLILGALAGTPIFIVLGGIAYMLFTGTGNPLEIIANESYGMLTSNNLPAIPLFTMAGFILSESGAGKRFIKLFQAFFGWLPGGMAIMAIIVSSFFTTFTGATGVTILALGALLYAVLVESKRYTDNFGTGLLTASGSIGLLFPPSLPIIIYGVAAQVDVMKMFVGGIIPGFLMMFALIILGVGAAVKRKETMRTPFSIKEAVSSLHGAIWEVLLPVIILVSYFGGLTTLVETAALAAVYAFVVETIIIRDLKLKDIPRVFMKCAPIIGGVLIILAASKGLSYFIIDAEIPLKLTAWVETAITSKYLFLILLNIALLITGMFMDIFSAIMVIAPLIIPLGNLFGIHPVHLGIIFLANLQLGYLTPPVGLNLFLASYRFNQPLVKISKNIVPFFLILLVTVLLITYVPWFSLGLLNLFNL